MVENKAWVRSRDDRLICAKRNRDMNIFIICIRRMSTRFVSSKKMIKTNKRRESKICIAG